MKFNKKLNKIVEKNKLYIPYDFWFNYKGFKKVLNDIKRLNKAEQKEIASDTEDCCCICLENDNTMQTFCCKNCIHHTCLFRVLSSNIASCPICRADIYKVLKFTNEREYYNAKVISLISMIQLNINRIEDVVRQKYIFNHKYMKIFIQYNRLAIIKMCKKIDKNLHISCKQYFIDVMDKHGILKAETRPHSLLERLYSLLQAK